MSSSFRSLLALGMVGQTFAHTAVIVNRLLLVPDNTTLTASLQMMTLLVYDPGQGEDTRETLAVSYTHLRAHETF